MRRFCGTEKGVLALAGVMVIIGVLRALFASEATTGHPCYSWIGAHYTLWVEHVSRVASAAAALHCFFSAQAGPFALNPISFGANDGMKFMLRSGWDMRLVSLLVLLAFGVSVWLWFRRTRFWKRVSGAWSSSLAKERIWTRDKETCQCCGKPVAFRDATVHPVAEHFAAGTTIVENSVLVCQVCHADRALMQSRTLEFREHLKQVCQQKPFGN